MGYQTSSMRGIDLDYPGRNLQNKKQSYHVPPVLAAVGPNREGAPAVAGIPYTGRASKHQVSTITAMIELHIRTVAQHRQPVLAQKQLRVRFQKVSRQRGQELRLQIDDEHSFAQADEGKGMVVPADVEAVVAPPSARPKPVPRGARREKYRSTRMELRKQTNSEGVRTAIGTRTHAIAGKTAKFCQMKAPTA